MWYVLSNTMRHTEREAPKYGIDIRDREKVLVVDVGRYRTMEGRRLEVGDIILDLTILAAPRCHATTWEILERNVMMTGAKIKQTKSSHRLYIVEPLSRR